MLAGDAHDHFVRDHFKRLDEVDQGLRKLLIVKTGVLSAERRLPSSPLRSLARAAVHA